jgi:hypothetical protein
MRRKAFSYGALLVLIGCILSVANAQKVSQAPNSTAARSQPNPATGIITERISPKDLLRWQAIERLVFAENNEKQYLYPTLRGLWEWIETSGHAIYIEFAKPTNALTSTAGNFRIEKLDPRGEQHVGVIQLYLNNIDLAYVGPAAFSKAGFIPFTGLSREERYAEVLGHELAHAADILSLFERAEKVEEMVQKTNEMLLHHRSLNPTEQISVELKHRLSRRDVILHDLEGKAERMEARIWRELANAKAKIEKGGRK